MTPIAQRIERLSSAPRMRQTMPVSIKVLPSKHMWVDGWISTLGGAERNLGQRDTFCRAVVFGDSLRRRGAPQITEFAGKSVGLPTAQ